MNVKKLIHYRPFLLFPAAIILISCQLVSSAIEPAAAPQMPTAVPESAVTAKPETGQLPTSEKPSSNPTETSESQTIEPTIPSPKSTTSSNAPEVTPESKPVIPYQVTYLEEGDVLNVRGGPGVANDIVGELSAGESEIEVSGAGQEVQGSLWLPVTSGPVSGWVNSRFMTEVVSSGEFCANSESQQILSQVLTVIDAKDGDQLAALVAEGRGLRFRRHWWNPEVRLEQEEVSMLFDSKESYTWGVADGSGLPIEGTFNSVLIPLFERNLSGATESGCNEIIHGGTAGLVTVPSSYKGINYYSMYRPPGPDDFELDWGTWVIGIEKWQGQYYLSYFVHYEWEI